MMTAFRISSYSYDQHARKTHIQPTSAVLKDEQQDAMGSSVLCRQNGAHNRGRSITTHTDQDFNGVTNTMRKVSLHSHRKWRPVPVEAWSSEEKNPVKRHISNLTKDAPENESGVPENSDTSNKQRVGEKNNEKHNTSKSISKEKRSNREFTKSSIKIRYPRPKTNASKSLFEETLPPCLRQFRAYHKYSRRELCSHTPIRSVTSLSSHQVKSRGLPHPGLDTRGRRRPWSAPPTRQVSAPRNITRQRPASAHSAAHAPGKVNINQADGPMTSSFRFKTTAKPPSTPRIEEEAESVDIVGRPDSANSMYSDDFEEEVPFDMADRTGSYHFVHETKPKQAENITITVNDEDIDEDIPEDIPEDVG